MLRAWCVLMLLQQQGPHACAAPALPLWHATDAPRSLPAPHPAGRHADGLARGDSAMARPSCCMDAVATARTGDGADGGGPRP